MSWKITPKQPVQNMGSTSADQILFANMEIANQNNLSYMSGSIEYDPIKGKSIDILEGTKLAFDNRSTTMADLGITAIC